PPPPGSARRPRANRRSPAARSRSPPGRDGARSACRRATGGRGGLPPGGSGWRIRRSRSLLPPQRAAHAAPHHGIVVVRGLLERLARRGAADTAEPERRRRPDLAGLALAEEAAPVQQRVEVVDRAL